MFDFELLQRCISKIWNQPKIGVYEIKYQNWNDKIVYINCTVEFLMFILVSTPFEFVTGELEGISWWTLCVHEEKG